MMSSKSSCMDGYGNFPMHQQQVSSNFYNELNGSSNQQQRQQQSGSYGYPGDWAGSPLGKSPSDVRHKKLYGTRSNGHDYDESSMSRLAKHTHGAPIIMSSRYRSKSAKPVQTFVHESKNLRNQNAFSTVPSADETQTYDDSGYHANGTCLPRIIKPRKRRKKDRKPVTGASMENNPQSPFTFASNQSSGFMQNMSSSSNNGSDFAFHNQMNDNFRHPAPPPNESNLFFNCDFDPGTVLPLPSSTSSSPISMSNSSLSSSTNTSSCSCRLCDPNCKIWAFPLRRSFSDNAAELEHHNNSNSDGSETRKKDVGVIGGNRVKTEWNSGGESTLSILDMIEFSEFQNQQRHFTDVNRLRSESSSDSGDSGCDLLLNGLNISDDIVSSTMKTVSDSLTNERLNAITKQLTDFSLMAQNTSTPMTAKEIIFHDSSRLSHLDANVRAKNDVCIDNPPEFSFNTKSLSSCDFGDHQRRRQQQHSNLDNFLAMDMAASGSNCNYGNLMSPMLVNKQNYGLNNSVDVNNNHRGAPDGVIDILKERTLLFDCFDVTWKGS